MDTFKRKLTTNISLFGGIVLILGGLLVILGFDIGSQTQKIRTQRESLVNRTQSVSTLANLQNDFNESQKYLSALENILPTRDQLIDFPRELEIAARNQNLGFGFSFGNEKSPSNSEPGATTFSVTLQGTQTQIFNFVRFLEQSRFLISFSTFDMNRSGERFNTTIRGEVFFK